MLTVLKDFSILLLVLAVSGMPARAADVNERNNAILQFREAEPAKRGPASAETDSFTTESLETQEAVVPGILVGPAPIPVVPADNPYMSRRTPSRGNFSPIPRGPNMSVIPAPNQTIPDYPWPDYRPDVIDAQTEGTICTSCLYNQIRGKNLIDQAYEIRRAVDTATGGVSGNEFARRLQEGAIEAARRCRKMADFRGGGQSCKIYKNPELHFRKSKGLCATGVQEAFKAAGKELGRGHGNGQDANLAKAGMIKAAKFEPDKLPGGSVLTCNGPTKWGHIEIVVVTGQGREFCSDFCSPKPTCGRGSYRQPRAYTWPGT